MGAHYLSISPSFETIWVHIMTALGHYKRDYSFICSSFVIISSVIESAGSWLGHKLYQNHLRAKHQLTREANLLIRLRADAIF